MSGTMQPKPRVLRYAACAAFTILVACSGSDSRTEQIQPGLSRDSALAILAEPMGKGSAPASDSVSTTDSLKNVWRKTQYLVNGKNIEILWYSPGNERWRATDTIPAGRVIPVVLIDGKVVGVGRTTYEQMVTQYGLPKNKY